MAMKIQFLGGAEEVGRMAMLYENGVSMLFDYGFAPTKPPQFPQKVPDNVKIKDVFLTHAHLDHSGMLPWLSARHRPRIMATEPTIAVSDILLHDCLNVWAYEGNPQPYGEEEIEETMRSFVPIRYGMHIFVDDKEIIPHPAGHIPGSAMYEIRDGDTTVLFTGDINTIATRLMKPTHPISADVLIIESTYAGREHMSRDRIEYEFLSKVEEVVDRGGKVIVPAFAVGRTQEMMLLLHNRGYEIWLDGMGKTVNKIYFRYPEYIKNLKALKKAKNDVRVVHSPKGREKALRFADVILTTSGMLDGGPVLWYIDKIKDDKKNAILLTGYQVEGTNGRMLLNEGKLEIYGAVERVKCEVGFFDFSAHAGHSQLLDFIKGCKPEVVVLCHGDNREALAAELDDMNVYVPKNCETVMLDI